MREPKATPLPNRLAQVVLIGSLLPLSWLLMMLVHELGHVLGAAVTGGQVVQFVWHPLAFSRTDVSPNPEPLVVVWAGPVVGVLLPLVLWGLAVAARQSWAYLLRFFAGFCLVVNGAYIGGGSFGRYADCGEMITHGSPSWMLWLFGLACLIGGFLLWNGQGKKFGLGHDAEPVSRTQAWFVLGLLIGVLAAGFMYGDRGL